MRRAHCGPTYLKHPDELLGVGTGVLEAEGVETDLRDECVVGDHHSAGAEERLQVVGQLGTTRVTCGIGQKVEETGVSQSVKRLERDA